MVAQVQTPACGKSIACAMTAGGESSPSALYITNARTLAERQFQMAGDQLFPRRSRCAVWFMAPAALRPAQGGPPRPLPRAGQHAAPHDAFIGSAVESRPLVSTPCGCHLVLSPCFLRHVRAWSNQAGRRQSTNGLRACQRRRRCNARRVIGEKAKAGCRLNRHAHAETAGQRGEVRQHAGDGGDTLGSPGPEDHCRWACLSAAITAFGPAGCASAVAAAGLGKAERAEHCPRRTGKARIDKQCRDRPDGERWADNLPEAAHHTGARCQADWHVGPARLRCCQHNRIVGRASRSEPRQKAQSRRRIRRAAARPAATGMVLSR